MLKTTMLMSHRRSALCAIAASMLLCGPAFALDASKGVYRIPYANGTEVKVSNDHIDHKPPGRIDMGGRGGGPYKIVAAADGFVRHVVDGFDKRLDCDGVAAADQKNNYVWIEHANGEWTKYTHMRKGSSSGKAKLKVGQFVEAGTYLGDEGDVGCATGDHLHFEVGVPKASGGIATVGGFLTDNSGSKRNRIPRICGIDGGRFASGKTYDARNVPGAIKPGAKEVARHGVPGRDYQCLFDQASMAGYALEWIDGFSVGGDVRYNAIFRPAGTTPWQAVHGLNATQYQQRFDQLSGQGYRPTMVESYADGGSARYAAIFRKQGGPEVTAYHGLSAQQHQQRMDSLTATGFRPRNVAVTSVGGERRYTALYEKVDMGSWQSKSQLTANEYQQAVTDNDKQGRRLVYVNVYGHGSETYFSAIWSSKANATYKARHGLTSAQYQSEWEASTGAGLLTRAVSGYSEGGSARYAAIWRK